MPDQDQTIAALVETFSRQLIAAVEDSAARRVEAAISGALGRSWKHGKPTRRLPTPTAPGLAMTASRKVGAKQTVSYSLVREPGKLRDDLSRPWGAGQGHETSTRQGRDTHGRPGAEAARSVPGILRSLKGADRTKVQRMANAEGVAEAVKLAHSPKKA